MDPLSGDALNCIFKISPMQRSRFRHVGRSEVCKFEDQAEPLENIFDFLRRKLFAHDVDQIRKRQRRDIPLCLLSFAELPDKRGFFDELGTVQQHIQNDICVYQ